MTRTFVRGRKESLILRIWILRNSRLPMWYPAQHLGVWHFRTFRTIRYCTMIA
jgi:hypothetical protein